MKNNCCLFETLFLLIIGKLMFLYYANQESDDITTFATKMVKISLGLQAKKETDTHKKENN